MVCMASAGSLMLLISGGCSDLPGEPSTTGLAPDAPTPLFESLDSAQSSDDAGFNGPNDVASTTEDAGPTEPDTLPSQGDNVAPEQDDNDCEYGDTKTCATPCGTPGTQTCVKTWGECVGPDELCNGLDDDCDGDVDEDFEGLGEACDGADTDM